MSETKPARHAEDRRVRRTKKMLLQALTTLLREKPVKDITVRELADLADVNRGTFYLYYRDVYDMLDQVESELFNQFETLLTAHHHEMITGTKNFLLDLFTFIEENKELCGALLNINGDISFVLHLNEVLRKECMEEWKAVRGDIIETGFDYHYTFVVFGCIGLIHTWVNNGCQEPAEDMADLADRLIRHGSIPG